MSYRQLTNYKKNMTICGECAGWVLSLTMIVGCFGIYKHSDFTCNLWFGLN